MGLLKNSVFNDALDSMIEAAREQEFLESVTETANDQIVNVLSDHMIEALQDLPVYWEQFSRCHIEREFKKISNEDAQILARTANAFLWELQELLVEKNKNEMS